MEPQFLRVKNWERFQHYKKRNPPWIKLHRSVFDDYAFQSLSDRNQYDLVRIWMLASTDSGTIPNESRTVKRLCKLNHPINLKLFIEKGFLVEIASATLSPCKQNSIPETEIEVETETDKENTKKKSRQKRSNCFSLGYSELFQKFWEAYPNKVGKGKAYEQWNLVDPQPHEATAIIESVKVHCKAEAWRKDGGKWVPHPSTFLHQRRWEDATDNQVFKQESTYEKVSRLAEEIGN